MRALTSALTDIVRKGRRVKKKKNREKVGGGTEKKSKRGEGEGGIGRCRGAAISEQTPSRKGGGQQTLPQRQQDSGSIVARERLPADRGSDQVLNSSKSAND